MRVLVFGGRDSKKKRRSHKTLSAINKETPISVIIEGGATGEDRFARIWAETRNIKVETYEADWQDFQAVVVVPRKNKLGEWYNAAAGNLRNMKMLKESKPDMAVEFPGGRGTADMHRLVMNEMKRRTANKLPDLRYLKVEDEPALLEVHHESHGARRTRDALRVRR